MAFALRRDFPWRRVPGYIAAQLLGAGLACLLLWALFGKGGGLGATAARPRDTPTAAAFGIETVLTFGLVSVILGTASRAQNLGPLSAVGVGAYIVLAGLWASPVSGASMNPARSFGPDAVLPDFSVVLDLRARAAARRPPRRRRRLDPQGERPGPYVEPCGAGRPAGLARRLAERRGLAEVPRLRARHQLAISPRQAPVSLPRSSMKRLKSSRLLRALRLTSPSASPAAATQSFGS